MNSCASNRKLIVWQTLNALDGRQTRQLREHLETCADCRRYMAEISNVTENLAAAETNPAIQASENFHRSVAQRLRAAQPASFGERLAAHLRNGASSWRVAALVATVLVLIGVILATWPRPSLAPSPALALESDNDLAPTLANYERAADQSLEKFDALLTRQSRRAGASGPSYTASTRGLAKELF
jgi:anti-sigma-K factor RskA